MRQGQCADSVTRLFSESFRLLLWQDERIHGEKDRSHYGLDGGHGLLQCTGDRTTQGPRDHRAALCGDETCAMPVGNPGHNFGIHTVNTSARPSGSMSNADVEALVSSKLQAAFQAEKYDSFMDFAAVFYTTSLDKYISAFKTDGVLTSSSVGRTKLASSGTRCWCSWAAPSSLSNSCRGRRPLWVAPSRTLCSACLPQFSLRIKSPNSRSTSSRFLRFRKGVPTSRT